MSTDRATTVAGIVACVWFVLIVALFVTAIGAGWHYITTDTALYELETGEYLHCTPQGGNNLTCEVTHRKYTE